MTDFPGHIGRWQVSSGGGVAPAWSPDGTQLYFQRTQLSNVEQAASFLMAASFDGRSAAPVIGTPVQALSGPYDISNEYGRSFDVSPKGDRFLMVHRRALDAPVNVLTVVVCQPTSDPPHRPGLTPCCWTVRGGEFDLRRATRM